MPASSSIRRAPPRTFKMIKRPTTTDASLLLKKEQRKKLEIIRNHHSNHAIVSSMRHKPGHSNRKASSGNKIPHELVIKGEVIYRECRKNHAASMGGYIVDGCPQFLAAGEEGTNAALSCASCSCHRSFHKKLEKEINQLCDSASISNSTSTAPQS